MDKNNSTAVIRLINFKEDKDLDLRVIFDKDIFSIVINKDRIIDGNIIDISQPLNQYTTQEALKKDYNFNFRDIEKMIVKNIDTFFKMGAEKKEQLLHKDYIIVKEQ